MQKKRRVVITGIGVITPLGNEKEKFWENLTAGKSGTDYITHFDTKDFPSKIGAEVRDFNPLDFISPKEAKRMDKFIQFAVAGAKLAAADANLDLDKIDRNRAGVLVGSGIGGIETIEREHRTLISKGPSRISPFLIPMLIVNMAPGQISMKLGLRGPNSCVATACSSGSHAVGDAFKIIQRGDAEIMLGGGTETALTPLGFGGFCSMRALSTRNDQPEKASRPFDKLRDGFIMGEGAGIVILESLEHAQKRGARIYSEICGYGLTGDAYHITAPAPGGEGAVRCIRMALQDAGLSLEDVDYINAHGTSTPLNDKYETMAIKTVFGKGASKIAVSSTKSMTGHLLGAAGGVEAAICALILERNIIPPTINYEYPDPDCDLDYVPNQARKAEVKVALSNSLG
ncbi:MAG: beta-ketoacyl-ACP synthase II, partial [Candidatus Ratteibacteria bacterium]|nr:beta-ketoacyl-ACP synthase II [Candidatus Ratteibacteria bacterium]